MAKQKLIGMIALGAVFCLLTGAPSFAAVVNPGDTILFTTSPHRGTSFPGGAFKITDTKTNSWWYTFCLEYSEHISLTAPSNVYTVQTVVPYATAGGGGAFEGKDYISSKTAYLYSLYATGGLGFGLGFDDGTKEQQIGLQNTFWFLENEISTLPGDHWTQYYSKLVENIVEDGKLYGVLVVNPINSAGGPAQSQLVYVPEAGALLLFGTGLVGLVGYRRVRRVRRMQ